MAITISPVGLTAAPVANTLSVLAVINEHLCDSYCVDSTLQPQVTVAYTQGQARLVDTTLFIPITAVITVVTQGNCCKANTRLFTERFVAAFQDVTALPTAITVDNLGRDLQPANVDCGRAKGIVINDSLRITITPAAAAASA